MCRPDPLGQQTIVLTLNQAIRVIGGGGGFVCAKVGVAKASRTPVSATKTASTQMSDLVVLGIIDSPR